MRRATTAGFLAVLVAGCSSGGDLADPPVPTTGDLVILVTTTTNGTKPDPNGSA